MNRIKPTSHTLFGLLLGVSLVLYLSSKASSNVSQYIDSMMQILNDPILKPHKNLYLDSKLLQFLHETRIYNTANPNGFADLSKHTDHFIELAENILSGQNRNYNEQYETLKNIKIHILNIFHAFVYVTPHIDSRLNFYQSSLKKLESLLNYQIDRVHTYVVNKNNQGVTNRTMFPMRNAINGPPKELTMSVVNRYNYFG